MIISIPSVIILSSLILSLYGGSIRFTTPMLFALAFLPMFGIGGLTGLPLGLAATDIPLHDTNYVVGHFHYLVAPGTIFALFAGIYYWFPEVTGRMMNDGSAGFISSGSFVCMNVIFLPMFIQGLAGVNRRLWDGGAQYAHAQDVLSLNVPMSYRGVRARILPALLHRQPVREPEVRARARSPNPWQATTLEWSRDVAPPLRVIGNFDHGTSVSRDAYDYSVPGAATDFTPQNAEAIAWRFPTRPRSGPTPGVTNPKLGIWLFLASEVMLFGSLFSSYALLRSGAMSWPDQSEVLSVPLATLNTVILISSSVTMVLSWAVALKARNLARFRLFMGLTLLVRRGVPGGQGLRVRRQVLPRPVAVYQQLPRPVFHDDRPPRDSRHRRHGRERVPARA